MTLDVDMIIKDRYEMQIQHDYHANIYSLLISYSPTLRRYLTFVKKDFFVYTRLSFPLLFSTPTLNISLDINIRTA